MEGIETHREAVPDELLVHVVETDLLSHVCVIDVESHPK